MSEPLITDHTWRAPVGGSVRRLPLLERKCRFMNCGRPIDDHARATFPPRTQHLTARHAQREDTKCLTN